MSGNHPDTEESLDPQDWAPLRALAHQMVDEMLDHLQTIRQRPAWQPLPEALKPRFQAPLPLEPQPPAAVYAEFKEAVLPYPIGNTHPRFWGWLFGQGTVLGALAEFLAAVMNTNSGDMDHHSAIHVETQVLAWLKELMGFPASASGLLTTGCSAANLIGLAVALSSRAGFDLRREGLAAAPQRLVLYASQEAHSSIQKAVVLLGLGSEALRLLPVDAAFALDVSALEAAIERDRQAGLRPFCVVGMAGTASTGAVDDLNALADLCARQDLWLHVDGAFGAWARLAPGDRDRVAGIERADSLAFDLHKWMYMPYEIGCLLVRDAAAHRAAFALPSAAAPAYLAQGGSGRGLAGGGDLPWLTDYGFELSRGFRALKAWMSFKEHGLRKYARLIEQNLAQARYFAALVAADPGLELLAPPTLNVVCFRYLRPGLDELALEALNREILLVLQEQGIAVLSGTVVSGKYALRLGHTNHRSRREDFDLLAREVIRIGDELG